MINGSIRKVEAKVVDIVIASKMEKPQVAYCRCWKSKTFPLCDGTHVKHNEQYKARGSGLQRWQHATSAETLSRRFAVLCRSGAQHTQLLKVGFKHYSTPPQQDNVGPLLVKKEDK